MILPNNALSIGILSLLIGLTSCQGRDKKIKIDRKGTGNPGQVLTKSLTSVPVFKAANGTECLNLPELIASIRNNPLWVVQSYNEDLNLYAKDSDFTMGLFKEVSNLPALNTFLKNTRGNFYTGFAKNIDYGSIRFPATQDQCNSLRVSVIDIQNAGSERLTNPVSPTPVTKYDEYKITSYSKNSLTYEINQGEQQIRYTVTLEKANTLLITKVLAQDIEDYCNVSDVYYGMIKNRINWDDDSLPTDLKVSARLAKIWESAVTLTPRLSSAIKQLGAKAAGETILSVPIQTYLSVDDSLKNLKDVSHPNCPNRTDGTLQ